MCATRIAHIADLHIPPLPQNLGSLSFKQVLGYLSWQGKRRHRHDSEVLDLLREDLKMQNCDHICVCGDQTNLGTEKEFQQATIWLQNLGPAQNISVVPGNHDAYSERYREYINLYWSPWMLDRDSKTVGLPFVRQVGDACVIGVSSAILTKPFMANGEVSTDQFEELDRLLAPLLKEDLYRVLMIHHPPVMGLAAWRKSLNDIKKVQHYLERFKIDMVLHGHLHVPMRNHLVFGERHIPVLGAASGSSKGVKIPPSQYFIIDVEKVGGNWNVVINSRSYNSAEKKFIDTALPKER